MPLYSQAWRLPMRSGSANLSTEQAVDAASGLPTESVHRPCNSCQGSSTTAICQDSEGCLLVGDSPCLGGRCLSTAATPSLDRLHQECSTGFSWLGWSAVLEPEMLPNEVHNSMQHASCMRLAKRCSHRCEPFLCDAQHARGQQERGVGNWRLLIWAVFYRRVGLPPVSFEAPSEALAQQMLNCWIMLSSVSAVVQTLPIDAASPHAGRTTHHLCKSWEESAGLC